MSPLHQHLVKVRGSGPSRRVSQSPLRSLQRRHLLGERERGIEPRGNVPADPRPVDRASDARDADSSSPLGPVGDALEQLSGAEAMTALMMAEMRASRGAVADLRREMRLERERAAQAEARQRRLLEQTRRAADAAVMTAESVAENQKNHMAKAMQAAETRTQSLEMLVPTGKRKKQQTEAAYTAADVAEMRLWANREGDGPEASDAFADPSRRPCPARAQLRFASTHYQCGRGITQRLGAHCRVAHGGGGGWARVAWFFLVT